jgi:hypothetical protein
LTRLRLWQGQGRQHRGRPFAGCWSVLFVPEPAALVALCVLVILQAFVPVYQHVWRTFHASFFVFSLIRFLLSITLLVVPTFLMGAALPLVSEFVSRDDVFVCFEHGGSHSRLCPGRVLAGAPLGQPSHLAQRGGSQRRGRACGIGSGREGVADALPLSSSRGTRSIRGGRVFCHAPLGSSDFVVWGVSLRRAVHRYAAAGFSGDCSGNFRRDSHVQRRVDLHNHHLSDDHRLSDDRQYLSAGERKVRCVHTFGFAQPIWDERACAVA